jgi:hydroxymethylpyrimidine pyrophosphatase-like HAD family hydrolase
MINPDSKTIAVDFDGTIVEHAYPKIGEEMLFAFATLRELQKKGHRLILWTYREGELLQEAVDYCAANGVKFYAVNESYPGERKRQEAYSRKIECDLFIDDRNLAGFPGWDQVWQILHPEGGEYAHQLKNELAHYNYKTRNKGSLLQRLLSRK